MTAYDKMQSMHTWISKEQFRLIVDAYKQTANVIETDDFFAVVKEVNINADYLDIVNPNVRFKVFNRDCYYIPFMCGDVFKIFDHYKELLPWVCFSRFNQLSRETLTKNDLRFYKVSRIKQIISKSTN